MNDPKPVAITNFWKLQDTNPKAFDAIYTAMIGDAYPRTEIDKVLSDVATNPFYTPEERGQMVVDMSESLYLPVLLTPRAANIEKHFGVKLYRKDVKRRPDVAPTLFELTHQ